MIKFPRPARGILLAGVFKKGIVQKHAILIGHHNGIAEWYHPISTIKTPKIASLRRNQHFPRESRFQAGIISLLGSYRHMKPQMPTTLTLVHMIGKNRFYQACRK